MVYSIIKVRKEGGSIVVTIPKEIVDELKVVASDRMQMYSDGDKIILRKVDSATGYHGPD